MNRRTFSAGLAGAATWPLGAYSQQSERMRRVGVLIAASQDDSELPLLLEVFRRALQGLGWTEGRNLQLEIRWAGGSADDSRRHAGELVALAPDVIVGPGSASAGPLLQATREIPVVFAIVPDPVGAGFVDSLARPGGNATGFASFEYGIGAKWLEVLREIAPGVKRVGVIRDSAITAGIGQWSAIQTAAPALGLDASPINLRDAPELGRAVSEFARAPNGGLIVTSSGLAVRHRDLIVAQAAKHRLPALYYSRAFVPRGGLISYGSDRGDQFRRAAGYVDRILRGEKPADLPVQAPSSYEMAINLKTAAALGLDIPPSLLARADEVIE